MGPSKAQVACCAGDGPTKARKGERGPILNAYKVVGRRCPPTFCNSSSRSQGPPLASREPSSRRRRQSLCARASAVRRARECRCACFSQTKQATKADERATTPPQQASKHGRHEAAGRGVVAPPPRSGQRLLTGMTPSRHKLPCNGPPGDGRAKHRGNATRHDSASERHATKSRPSGCRAGAVELARASSLLSRGRVLKGRPARCSIMVPMC